MQKRHNSIADAMELRLFCIKPLLSFCVSQTIHHAKGSLIPLQGKVVVILTGANPEFVGLSKYFNSHIDHIAMDESMYNVQYILDIYFCRKVNIWNVNCVQTTALIFDPSMDVLVKVLKF